MNSKKHSLVNSLITSRGYSLKNVAAGIGVGYHLLQKVVKHAPVHRSRSGARYETRHVREKVARWLNLPYDLVWGPESEKFLRKMIAKEIRRQAERTAAEGINRKLRELGLLDTEPESEAVNQ